MQIETLEDILSWTRLYHSQLSQCLKHCSDRNEEHRAKLLLDYLSDHETRLEKVIGLYEKGTNKRILNTWFYYLRKEMFLFFRRWPASIPS